VNYESAKPEARYAALNARFDEDLNFLTQSIKRVTPRSFLLRATAVILFLAAGVIPLLSHAKTLQGSLPAWVATLCAALATGVVVLDRALMCTENFTRWNKRKMRTMEFRDNFDARYAKSLREFGPSPTASNEQKLLADLEGAFAFLGTIRQLESDRWAAQYGNVVVEGIASLVRNRDEAVKTTSTHDTATGSPLAPPRA
jgi:hypothetical protein